MAVFFDGRCACGRELCDFTCLTYAVYMCKTQNNIGTWQERMKKPITNADRIRAMTDMELAKELSRIHGTCEWCPMHDDCDGENCDGQLLDWLREEGE